MSGRMQSVSILFLRWVLGLVVLWESFHFAMSAGSAHHVTRMGLPRWTAPVLGGVEILAAILFLIPKSTRIGGALLMMIFVIAVALHILHRDFEIGGLLVYIAAAWTCISASGR